MSPREEVTCTDCGGKTWPSNVEDHCCRACYEKRATEKRKRHWRVRNMWRWSRELRTRQQTYKSHEHSRRAFYKWVCKEGFFEPMRVGPACMFYPKAPGLVYYRDVCAPWGGMGYRRGYPSFESSRSYARDQWEREFEKYRDEIALRRLDRALREKRETIANKDWERAVKRMKKTALFFKMMAGTKEVHQ